MTRTHLATKIFGLLVSTVGTAFAQTTITDTGDGWPTYGGDAGGQRYTSSTQINRSNVSHLHPVWTYHTHALESSSLSVSKSDFEATPVLFQDTLYLTTPFDRIIALDPETGKERWLYDPHLPDDLLAANYTSRGVATWGKRAARQACASRIFLATLDARLIAVDATEGSPCSDFGVNGQVDLKANVATQSEHPYRFFGNTSPPTVVGDVVVVGSAVGDNQAVEVEPGIVRGFSARTGKLLWSWDPLPWAAQQHPRTSAANAWGVLAADPVHHLVFLPTGSASPDFYGGLRPGDDRDANSLVALDARTGRKVWSFQLIHHDVWDYDVASEPLLFNFQGHIPAIAIAAKTGIVFVFNRLTGETLVPIEERPVPGSDIPGEHLSRTQPFSSLPSLTPLAFNPSELLGHQGESLTNCQAALSKLRYDGVYTPPSFRGTLQFPGSLGGVNWGSMSFDPESGVLYSNVNHSVYEIRLIVPPSRLRILLHRRATWLAISLLILLASSVSRRQLKPGVPAAVIALLIFVAGIVASKPDHFRYERRHNMVNSPDSVGEVSPNNGTPYPIYRRVLQDDQGHPCTPTPWGATVALNLNAGKLLWLKPLGTLIPGEHTGTINFGAPIVTAGGLLFTAASAEPLLRAIDKQSGEEVWTGPLPVPAQSTPMSYTMHGRQFVVVDAGGNGGLGTPLGDSVIAFALDQ